MVLNSIGTADVYGDGESEKAVGRIVRYRKERICSDQMRSKTIPSHQRIISTTSITQIC